MKTRKEFGSCNIPNWESDVSKLARRVKIQHAIGQFLEGSSEDRWWDFQNSSFHVIYAELLYLLENKFRPCMRSANSADELVI